MNDEISELELMTKRLEVEKLRAEVQTAQLSWWKRPGYLGGLTPILLALVGVGTAWVTGYFDTQRTQLATEIEALEDTKQQLEDQIAQSQKAIDYGYLQAKLAAYDADYAIGHFEAFSDQVDGVEAMGKTLRNNIPTFLPNREQIVKPLEDFLDVLVQQQELGMITQEAVESVLSRLEQIEASAWVKDLETDPMLSSENRFRDASGRIFDIEMWDWVDG